MFTGIIQNLGYIKDIQHQDPDCTLSIAAPNFELGRVAIGDSVAINGVCLTVVSKTEHDFSVDVSKETLNCTTLKNLAVDSRVNLEKALTLSTPLGGHLVTGHVDGVGEVVGRKTEGQSIQFNIQAPAPLRRYIAPKGCITVDGISLTVNAVDENSFGVNIIPHTSEKTTLQPTQCGDKVNIEVDLIARYLERLYEHKHTTT